MDPQECLKRIIEINQRLGTTPPLERERVWGELAQAFEDLAGWLQKGGFPPTATGPICGYCQLAVGYPGMALGAQPRYEPRPIVHVRSQESNWRYALLVQDACGEDLSTWVLREYTPERGDAIRFWVLPQAAPNSDTTEPAAEPAEHCVWIVWGNEKQPPQRYDFNTLEELNAFLLGVDEASGWLDYEQFDTEAEAEASFAGQQLDDEDEEATNAE